MRPNAPRRCFVPLACLTLACLLSACASPRAGSYCGEPVTDAGPAQPVALVDGTMSGVRDDFNAHADVWRVVLLTSPVCSECVLGARAVEREIMARYPAEQVHATVVWVRMLDGDSAESASAASGIIARANATHFYDDAQVTGWAWHRGPFAGMARRVKAALPPGHWISQAWAEHREDSPQWDVYMLYAPGVKWAGADAPPPAPSAWIRHIGRTGERREGPSVYWRDSPDTPPREGGLYEAMREMADETMGKPMNTPSASATTTTGPKIELLGFPDCPNTPAMRANLTAALASVGKGWTFTDTDQEQLPEGDLRRGWPTPTILVNGRDLFGMPAPTAPAMGCRMYPGGVPNSSDIAGKITTATAHGTATVKGP